MQAFSFSNKENAHTENIERSAFLSISTNQIKRELFLKPEKWVVYELNDAKLVSRNEHSAYYVAS